MRNTTINTGMFSRVSRSHLCEVCLSATNRRSFFSSASAASILPSLPPSTGFARLTNRALILLYGPDAAHYLQGLTTTNIKDFTFDSLEGFYTAFLNAQGRVLHDVFVYPIDHTLGLKGKEGITCDKPGFMIDVDKAHAETLRSHLKRYKLRAKIAIEPADWHIWATWDDAIANNSQSDNAPSAHNFGCVDPRAPGMGKRILSFADISKALPGEETSVEHYDIRRILKGVPQGHREIISGEALPQESNIDYMSGIDFRKGCYVGQELTIRTRHTGVVRKRILPVQLYNPDEKPPGSLQYDPSSSLTCPDASRNIARVDTRGRSAGKFLRGVGNIGLALCRLETMTDVKLTEEGSQWSPENEFKVSWPAEEDQAKEKKVKIKAFVPEWHRNRVSVRNMHQQQNV
ncbi:MAG: hypothetical protein L6R38_005800 [Xanthoria sp. 2 TBL-2021]|nr:MAG: hypothetical protein L6R38_005800 [Xanthoria sp. 2 TBL-2021]